jgi:hypothetical protein
MKCKVGSGHTCISVASKQADNKSNESKPSYETQRIKIRITSYKEGMVEDDCLLGCCAL